MGGKAAAYMRLEAHQSTNGRARDVYDLSAVEHAQRCRVARVAGEFLEVSFGEHARCSSIQGTQPQVPALWDAAGIGGRCA